MKMMRQPDWFRIIHDLQKAGLNKTAIAARIGSRPSTVGNWLNNLHEPLYSSGEALIGLWMRTTGKPMKDVPRAGS